MSLVGQGGAWFSIEKQDEAVVVRPRAPLSRRCTIRVAALFEHEGDAKGTAREQWHTGGAGHCSVSTVMGRVAFARGAHEPQVYRPYTLDPRRKLRELYFPVEAMPDDEWQASIPRWQNYQAVAKRLLIQAGIQWRGLDRQELEELTLHVPYPEPVEGCVLHALTQWSAEAGECVVEIGSFHGRSLTMLAMALRGLESESPLISVDPHMEHPWNRDHVRLSMRQLGEENRLVQFVCGADQAARLLRPGTASMVFIDGDHAYEQVLADYENYRELVAPGGVMAFHDFDFSDHNGLPALHPGVRRTIEGHVMRDGSFRPLLLAHTLFAFVKQGCRV
ncbi:MAG: class I SAM-dependent methyltransferase [Phycisphaerae bacterium]|nr:class I SAM-dependent methyltransferase [Phycisphaerae bacterium]